MWPGHSSPPRRAGLGGPGAGTARPGQRGEKGRQEARGGARCGPPRREDRGPAACLPSHFAPRRRPPRHGPCALTVLASGGRPQHPQQYVPPAEEPHGAGRPGPPPRPKGNRRRATRVALPAGGGPGTGSPGARAGPRRHLGSWQPPRAPSWCRAAGLWLVAGAGLSALCKSQAPDVSGLLELSRPPNPAGFQRRPVALFLHGLGGAWLPAAHTAPARCVTLRQEGLEAPPSGPHGGASLGRCGPTPAALPGVAGEDTGCPVKFAFYGNNEQFFTVRDIPKFKCH